MSKTTLFRRLLAPALIFALLWGVCLTGSAAGPGGYDYGDVSADGRIDATDALWALQSSVSLRELTAEERERADVNADHVINASDALFVLQYAVGLIDQFDVEKKYEPKEGLYGMTYRYEDGKYIQYRDAVEVDGYRTVNSNDRLYAPSMHVNVDAALINRDNAESWRSAGLPVGTSGSFNHTDGGEYEALHPEDLQLDANGSPDAAWNSLVLTPGAIQHVIDHRITSDLTIQPWVIDFVEPEMFRRGLYGEGYKKLWKDTYGTDWVDPLSSPEAVFLSQRLNISTHVNAINAYADYIKANASGVKFGIAPHSTMAYSKFDLGITDGYHHMLSTGKVDMVTGQTWSNTIINPFLYGGVSTTDPFLHGVLGYGSYLDAAIHYGVDFYALNDAMSDTANGQNEPYWRGLNHDQLVASLLYGEINRWQFIWTNRSFMYVSPEYRAEQMNIYNAMKDISGREYTLTAGTPGVTYLLSDTLAWQIEGNGWCKNPYESFYGVTMPLLRDGIPVRTKAMELIDSPDDLAGVSLLIVSYDNMKPLSEEVNIALSDWVKAGGTLLYLGGPDAYVGLESEWWNAAGKGGSPLQNLLQHLGLNAQATTYEEGMTYLQWAAGTPDDKFDPQMLTGLDSFTYSFTGEGFEPVMTSLYGDTIAIESKVGQGHFIAAGLPTHFYAESEGGADLMRILTEYALRYTDFDYVTSDSFIVQRGNYTAVHSLTGGTTLEGRYVDIFSDTLDVVSNPTVAARESRLFYEAAQELTIPCLSYTGGIQDALTESADTTTLTYHGAENALVASRFLSPEGMAPTSVTATDSKGHTITPATSWDAASSSLLVQTFTTPTNPITIEVEWGGAASQVPNNQYEYFELAVNSEGQDKPYIVRDTSAARENCRFTDGDAELVYRFDISGYASSLFALSLYSNYLIEVSPDGESWTTAVDFSAESEQRATALNTAVRVVNPDDFGIRDTIYIRMRNTDPSQGWGGALEKITVQYLPVS